MSATLSSTTIGTLFAGSWLMPLDRLTACMNAIEHRLQTLQLGGAELAEQIKLADRVEMRMAGDVAVLRIHGVIEYRMTVIGWLFGGTSCEAFSRAFQQVVADPEVKSIVVSVDSPGGVYHGIPELAKEIFDARGAKGKGNIVAVADPIAASGALYLGTAFDEFVIAPSGEAGSVGAILLHTEGSRMFEEAGITNTIFRNPVGKVERNPFEPLTEEAREFAQNHVDTVYGLFVSALAKHRGVNAAKVRSDFGEGRMLMAKDAVSAGMADRTATLRQTLQKVGALGSRRKATQMEEPGDPIWISADTRKRRMEKRLESREL